MSGRVVARLARPTAGIKALERDASGADAPARKGLHVYLAPPVANDPEGVGLKFQHLVVGDGGALLDQTQQPVTLDRSTNHWCYWASAALQDAQVNRPRGREDEQDPRFQPVDGAFDLADVPAPFAPTTVLKGRGFALPTAWSGDALVLPGTKRLVVNVLDLFTRPFPDAQKLLDEAAHFWRQALIEVSFTRLGAPTLPPAQGPPWRLRGGDEGGDLLLEGKDGKPLAFRFDAPPFQPAQDPARALTLVLVDALAVGRAKGLALTTRPLTGLKLFKTNFTRPAKTGLLFVGAVDNATAGATNIVAHELGHCLLHDPGLGKNHLRAKHEQVISAFLDGLGLELGFDDLLPQAHVLSAGSVLTPKVLSNDLMLVTGGNFLVPWQLAVARAAHELTPRTGGFADPTKPAMGDP